MKTRFIFSAILIWALVVLASCYTPSPLYGKWQSNDGEIRITFMADGTITYTHPDSVTGESTTESGSWITYDNVLMLSFEKGSLLAEWDIRGSILYLNTGDTDTNGNAIIYTLFRISK